MKISSSYKANPLNFHFGYDNSNVANLGTTKNFASERQKNLFGAANNPNMYRRSLNTENIVYNNVRGSRTPVNGIVNGGGEFAD